MSSGKVYIRRLDVSARAREDGGLSLEMLIGIYALDVDAREVWRRIDGRASVGDIAEAIAAKTRLDLATIRPVVQGTCEELHELGVIEPA